MCFTRKPLSHRWAWLKLCDECAAKHGAAAPLESGTETKSVSAASEVDRPAATPGAAEEAGGTPPEPPPSRWPKL